jgi:hypothetical protein
MQAGLPHPLMSEKRKPAPPESDSAAFEKLWRQQRPSDLPDFKPTTAEIRRVSGANDRSATFWPAVFSFFLDGFASYAASLHRSSAGSVNCFEVEASANQVRASSGEPAIELKHDAVRSFEQSNVCAELDQVLPFDASRRGWLNSVRHSVLTFWKNWRRERQIKRTAAALAELDDQIHCGT